MRDQIYGTIQSAVCAAVEATGKRHQDVAEFLGIRGSTLSYGMEVSETRPGGLGVNYLHRLGADCPAAAVPLAQHFAALAGGVFQPVEAGGNVMSLISHCGVVAKENGEAVSSMLAASVKASAKTDREAVREIDEAVSNLMLARSFFLARQAVA